MTAKKISINRICNANIYLNGTNLLGRAIEVKLPDVNAIMSEHKMLGMIGSVELPTGGFEKLEGEIQWNSFYPEAWNTILNPFSTISLQCRSALDVYDSTGRSEQLPLVTFLNVIFTKNPLGTFKQNENAEFQSSFEAISVRQLLNGVEQLNIDYLSNVFSIAGSDQLEQYRDIIGG